MRIRKSFTKQGVIYYFDEYKSPKKTVENGGVNPNSKGTVLETVEVSFTNDKHPNYARLIEIFKDCFEPVLFSQGFNNCANVLAQTGQSLTSFTGDKSTIFIHVVQQ